MAGLNILIFLFLGIAPSLLWLMFYLQQDVHPEPRWMIRKTFLWGMFSIIPVLAVAMTTQYILGIFMPVYLTMFIYVVIGAPIVEEIAKYLVVRWRDFDTADFDEPTDVMIYMIVAALGFAAFENVWSLLGHGSQSPTSEIVAHSALRFVGATFLHALASGLLGYFMALSIYHTHRRLMYFIVGLTCAITLHSLFNFSILYLEPPFSIYISSTILIILSLLTFAGFAHLRHLKSITRLDD